MTTSVFQPPADQLAAALAHYREGFAPALIELPEAVVFPHLIAAQPSTARKARVTGVLLGRPAPRFVKRGRSVRYRLSDVLDWLAEGEAYDSTAAVTAATANQ